MPPLRHHLALLVLAAAVGGPAGAAPDWIPIAKARQQSQGSAVVVEGLVTVPSGDFHSSSGDQGFAVQDQTGGLWVSVKRNPGLPVGRRVRVRGTLGQSAGKLQIAAEATGIERLPGRELRVATGQVGPATLGFLISVEGQVTQAAAPDLPYGYKLFLDDGSGPVQIYLNLETHIDPKAPDLRSGRWLRVTGFGNQYDTTYEVDPRSRQDLRPLPAPRAAAQRRDESPAVALERARQNEGRGTARHLGVPAGRQTGGDARCALQ